MTLNAEVEPIIQLLHAADNEATTTTTTTTQIALYVVIGSASVSNTERFTTTSLLWVLWVNIRARLPLTAAATSGEISKVHLSVLFQAK